MVQGRGGYILAYDAGGSTLLLLNQKGEICSNPTLAGAVYDADLTEDGYLCYVTAGSAVKSELQLLDREQRSVFAVHAATRYFTGCAAAPRPVGWYVLSPWKSRRARYLLWPWYTARTGRIRVAEVGSGQSGDL